jgi:hypothetical protein
VIRLARSVTAIGSAAPALLAAVLTSACASGNVRPWEYSPTPLADTLAIAEPAEIAPTVVYEQIAYAMFLPLSIGGGGPAWNADPFDEVVNSTWFTNRNATRAMTPEEIARGPHASDGPDQSGPAQVTSMKSEGVNVGFFLRDASGARWLVKFDPPEYEEMASGSDVLATNLVWAAGYHTPENYVFYLDPTRLTLRDGVELEMIEDGQVVEYEVGANEPDERELTMDVFQRFIARYPRDSQGRIRTLASKFLPGIPKGPFGWKGTRPDDPNDVIPHENRRELRGYYVVASWINQVDSKEGNTLDMFRPHAGSPEEGARFGHLVHYMLDNGASLGSGGVHPHRPRHGSENDLDMQAISLRLISLGAYERPWQDVEDTGHPESIGWFAADGFEPGSWKPSIPNPTFDAVDDRDGYWGAKLVMSFTDEQLEGAMEATEWSDASARAYILKGLEERRDAIGRYWFARVSPLDDPRVEGGAIVFDDLWTRHFGGAAQYRYDFDGAGSGGEGIADAARVPLPAGLAAGDAGRVRVRIWRSRAEGSGWAPRPVTMWLVQSGGAWRVSGVRY